MEATAAEASPGSERRSPATLAHDRYDVVIVGAGMAGLSLGALLAKDGRRVAVLEAIHYPGGCASSYNDRGTWFDVGATTVCGTDDGQPLRMLFDEIGWFSDLLSCDPSLSAVIGGRRLDLTTDRRLWYDRLASFFQQDQRRFWDEIFAIADGVYHALPSTPFIPPLSLRDLLDDLPGLNADLVRSVPWMFRSVASRLRRHGLDGGPFRRFVDAQLLITNQLGSEQARMLSGALGLSYANASVHTVRGGLITFARFLESRARMLGAEVAYYHRVTSIRKEGLRWVVGTKRGHRIMADRVVTAIPIFNLPDITEGEVEAYYRSLIGRVRRNGVQMWSAVTMTAVVPDTLPRSFPIHVQVLPDRPITSVGATSMFLSFSHPLDTGRSPSGTRALSVSMHIAPERFADLRDAATYDAWKAQIGPEVLTSLRTSVPELAELSPIRYEIGTPRTFQRYTGRADGMVGGIPLDRRLFPWSYPRPITPFDGLYAVGDTVFPGQGIPGVVLGALSLRRRLQAEDR
jgi:C-3',4' desaturase CrtD